ncbi:sodium:solute symporter family transporter [Nonomuraea sp. H19]|uniref:sodium:solute symporter family transporter n=1 Tax=Nonomuraea sp. H19 TaxID=3452206 RepID=UPI003F8ABF52
MPYYYRSKVRSVPEFLRRRFNGATQLLNAITFAVAQILIAGVNLYALALVMEALLGWPLPVSVVVSAMIVLSYITLGGLSSAIYNEVLQFFVILAGLIPLTVLGLMKVGGISGLFERVRQSALGEGGLRTWAGTAGDNPMQAHWIGIVFGLGFVLSFGYWTTNFAEVQRALSARNTNAARLTPIVAAYPKLFIPLVTVLPGMIALVLFSDLGKGQAYNNAIPLLMRDLLPNGVLGIAVTGLLASFMAGMAANISGFNTVFTNDIWQSHLRPDHEDGYYLLVGRVATSGGSDSRGPSWLSTRPRTCAARGRSRGPSEPRTPARSDARGSRAALPRPAPTPGAARRTSRHPSRRSGRRRPRTRGCRRPTASARHGVRTSPPPRAFPEPEGVDLPLGVAAEVFRL